MRNKRDKQKNKARSPRRTKYEEYSALVKYRPADISREAWSKLLAQELKI